jgi:holliday junction DNA helicase RuvA
MYEYIEGKLIELTPAYAVIEAAGIGYLINISLSTYSTINGKANCRLWLHFVVREDAQLWFGFYEKEERQLFRLLISVTGVGANTSRMILSSLSLAELKQAILAGNVSMLQSIKGIGLKTAQRLILDLKDKIGKESKLDEKFLFQNNTIREESLSALVMLGFAKNNVEKTLDKILARDPKLSLEDLIKRALKEL